jgi:bifunctional non-homologous end joining protein LigD
VKYAAALRQPWKSAQGRDFCDSVFAKRSGSLNRFFTPVGRDAQGVRTAEFSAARLADQSPNIALVDTKIMTLQEYRHKRDFQRTPEPKGAQSAQAGWLYLIQKHDASHLHYDFRLQFDGVLKSWAVPKGPSLAPRQKRLAVQVEDHPVEYGDFEGVIPEGEYGGGTVMLWDRGTWEPIGDPEEGLRQGKLTFTLHGEKLQGAWALIRKGGADEPGERNWFLIKSPDEAAQSSEEEDITAAAPLSVATHRSIDEIAAERDRVWGSPKPEKTSRKPKVQASVARRSAKPAARPPKAKSAAAHKSAAKRTRSRKATKAADLDPGSLPGARPARLAQYLEPQLCTLTKEAPEGDEWLHEMKFDGYRMLCRIDSGQVQFISRNDQDWTARLKTLGAPAAELPVEQALLDGEVVALEPNGVTDFQSLQNVFREGREESLLYYAFDLLYLDGFDLTGVVLEDRKRVLAQLVAAIGSDRPIRYSEHVVGDGPVFFENACKLGLEGIVSKRRDRPYVAGRGYDWLKVKCVKREEFVIGGYTEPAGHRSSLGALLVGYHDGDSQLRYAGKVGTGFSERTLHDLLSRLQPLERTISPFSNLTGHSGPARGAHWVEPALVAQVEFSNWTRDGRLRHPSFQGLREDKPAAEVVRDIPVPVDVAVEKSKTSAARHTTGKNEGQPMQPSKTAQSSQRSKPSAATSPQSGPVELAGIRLTHPEKVLYPDDGITKLDLARYYHEIADWILPHITGRPIVLVRCPEGRRRECFYQKHPGAGTPENLEQIAIQEKGKTANYLLVDDIDDLMSLVQLGALEIHCWGSRSDQLERPDRLIFDLDPDPEVAWPQVVSAARQIHQFLTDLGLRSFLKTTGGKGLHLVVPIQRRADWDEAKEFCADVAAAIVAADPQHYTSNSLKAARRGKIFVDYLRNSRGATAVAPYSTRARPGATVSVPLDWSELSVELRSDHFNIRNVPARLAALQRDPWEEIATVRQSLTASIREKLRALVGRR